MKPNEGMLIKRFGGDGSSAAEESSDTPWRRLGLVSFGARRDANAGETARGLHPIRVTFAMAADTTSWLMTEITVKSPASPISTAIAENHGTSWIAVEQITTANSSTICDLFAGARGTGMSGSDSRPSRIASAIAEIVGGYCHDFKRSFFDIVLSSRVPPPDVGWRRHVARIFGLSVGRPSDGEARMMRAVRHVQEMAEDLHRLVRQFYRLAPVGTDAEESILNREAAEARLRSLRALLVGDGRLVGIEVRQLGARPTSRSPYPSSTSS